ncbi:class I SAM-dependent DNA methyltransferase [Anaerotignum sp.]|uniref:class I SAM-dependent DNA methyltransferase n=1 Tax=Anaerotignum sp. TaxID=2039241 RepID=UPI002714CC19|nr:class I SAM-dependent methyltransferase [Anaerotignum sp.]
MEAYECFASVYDKFMDEIDYNEWVQYIQDLWKRLDKIPESVIDLGCGTGNVTIPLTKAGFSVFGVDISEEMLAEAQRKAFSEGLSIPFFCQDMVEMSLPYQVDCILSLCDSLNYLTEEGELSAAFSAVKRHLNPNGLFLFDMNTEYKFKEALGEKTYAAMTEDAAYFWENSFDEEERINEYYVSFFIRQKNKETYERVEEYHYERAYSLEEVKKCLKENDFELLNVYDGYSFERTKEDSQRYFFVAQLKEEK